MRAAPPAAGTMIHAFRLGPITSTGTPVFAYVGLVPGGAPRIHMAPGDREGLLAIQDEALGQPIGCEEALAEAARALGLEVAPLPADELPLRATLAYELATGLTHGASKPDAIALFLKAAAAFWGARTWELVGPEDRLHVLFEEGRVEIQGEVSVLGGDGTRFPGLALCDEPATLKKLAPLSGSERAEALLKLAGLTIDMEREPAWAAQVIGEAYTLPRVPTPQRSRHGRISAVVTQDLVMAAALLEGLAAYSGVEEGGRAEGAVEAAGLKVRAQLGPSAPPPSAAPEPSGLTPALTPSREEPALTPARPAPAPEPELTPSRQDPEPPPTPAPPAAQPGAPGAPEAPQAAAKAEEPELTPARPEPPRPAPPPEPMLTPVREAERTPVTAPAALAAEPADARPGWLSRAWNALRSRERKAETPSSPPEPAAGQDETAAPRPREEPRPAAAAPEPPAPPAPEHPFAALARALKVEPPADPPHPPAEDAEPLAGLAAKLLVRSAAAAELVAFPAVALQIVELVHSPRADATSVAGFISRDPALAADVVRVANSAAFRGVSEVGSVRDAVARLGLEEVGRVASAVAARKLLDPGGDAGDRARRTTALFARAVAVATAASAAALRQRGARSDHVWLGGLLHDVGRALAIQALGKLTAEGADQLTSTAVADRALEQVHVEVGAAALQRWGLPEWLRTMCARHHDEELPAAPELVDLHLVRLASALAWLRDPSVGARAAREILQSAAALGYGVPAVRALFTDLREAEQRAAVLAR